MYVITTEKSTECNSSVSDSPGSPFAAFRDYAENIKRYIRRPTGSYTSGLTANTKRAIRKATSSGQPVFFRRPTPL